MTFNSSSIELAIATIGSCRKNWISSGQCLASKDEIKSALLEVLKQTYNLPENVTWQNYRTAMVGNKVREELELINRNFEVNLKFLFEMGLTDCSGENVFCKINFNRLFEDLLCKQSIETSSIQGLFNDYQEFLIEVLKRVNLIEQDKNILKSTLTKQPVKDPIFDDVLTFIEQKDALQIRYGLYDSSMTGIDVISNKIFPDDPFFVKAEFGLRMLMSERFLLPLNIEEDILKWSFRSRIAEITRLVTKLRQRFEWHTSYQNSPMLTRGVKLEIRDRKFPVRSVSVSSSISSVEEQIRSASVWRDYADFWDELSSIIANSLEARGLSLLNNFQDRSFRRIFLHLINEESSLKGLVVSAGTGMGKTLSYIGPLLLYIVLEKSARQKIGTKAICIYPRIKLAENQIEGFVNTLYEINQRLDPSSPKITIGIDYSGTPYNRNSFTNEPKKGRLYTNSTNRYWRYDQVKDAYICPYARCPKCKGSLFLERKLDFSKKVPLKCLNSQCNTLVNFIEYCKEDIGSSPPDILIITTESLTRRLISSQFQDVFGTENSGSPKLVMIDEIHMHTSIKGSQVSYLIRRLLQRINQGLEVNNDVQGKPIVLGLSATIGQPEEFFSDLTGILKYNIDVEHPLEDELEKSGAEYYLFVKPDISENIAVISNLIQTSMCVLHNSVQHEEYPNRTNKALGFVDSLDLVKRWRHDLADAEKNGLFTFRDPNIIDSDEDVRNYFGPTTTDCAKCSNVVNTKCVHFQEGECWWFMRFGNSQIHPLSVTYKTGAEGEVPDNYDLVVTTSAMEVGYDDPNIMTIIQYQSPLNAASFTQRKGRAGRGIRNRPVTVAVLSPYRTKDVYTYRNHHMLIEPSFEKLPLNAENKAVRKIHGFYALLDFLAFQERKSGIKFTEYFSKENVVKLEEFSRRNRDIDYYLKRLLGYDTKPKEIVEIKEILKELIARIKTSNHPQEVTKILNEHLPANLFSSINLPTVKVCEYNVYSGDEQWHKSWRAHCSVNPGTPDGFLKVAEKGYCVEKWSCNNRHNCALRVLDGALDINMAISEASIANVTYRWGKTAYWIPPYDFEQNSDCKLQKMDIKNNWLVTSTQRSQIPNIPAKNIPKTLKPMLPEVESGKQQFLPVIRPDVIRETKFLSEGSTESHWLYCFDHNQIYPGEVRYRLNHKDEDTKNHRYDTITPKTTSYPFVFYDISFNQNGIQKDSRGAIKSIEYDSDFEKGKMFGIYSRLFNEIYFANKETDEYINVKKAVVGANCNIMTRKERVEKTFGYALDSDNVSLGYDMVTDGINLWVGNWPKAEMVEKECYEIYNTLKSNFFKFEVLKENKKPGGRNSYAVNAFLNVYLAMIANGAVNVCETEEYLRNGCENKDYQDKFMKVLTSFFTFNSRTKKAVIDLLEDCDFLTIVVTEHKAVLDEKDKKLIHDYITDTFHHSLKHALKSAFIVLGGFESERDVGGWTYLNFDSDFRKQIYVFENGMYGTGAFRSIYGKYSETPQKLWNIVEEYLVNCPTSDEEDFLRRILELDDLKLQNINVHFSEILKAKSFSKRKVAIENFLDEFRKDYSIELKEEHIKALNRVFTIPLELQGTTIDNWRLFRELNETFYVHYKEIYGRDLSSEEVQQRFFNLLREKIEEVKLPTWKLFFQILQSRTKNSYELFLRKIQNDKDTIRGLDDFLQSVNDVQLKAIHDLSEEEQIKRIKALLGSTTGKRAKKIADLLFSELDDIPMYKYYLHEPSSADFPKKDLETSLAKQSLREEIEKRLLNTCVDACPSCLQTSCEIDFELRSKLLLSRRLLKYVVSKLKEPFTVKIDEKTSYAEFKARVENCLKDKYQVIIRYSLCQSADVARVVSELLNMVIDYNCKKYRVLVNSSGYSEFSFKDQKILYEINLRCDEVL